MPGILVDQNIPRQVTVWMRQRGYEILTLTDAGIHGADDEKIAAYAVANNLVVLTQDRDFGEIYHNVYKRKLTVILVKTKDGTPKSIIETIENTHMRLDLKKLQNQLVIISKKRIRADM
ncbi:MAG: DUF5615 family PIN-like protein [Nitrososphaerota archaeon]|nr:DUF5615 family PIN-like protein [Nitrososphaerota archaeon]